MIQIKNPHGSLGFHTLPTVGPGASRPPGFQDDRIGDPGESGEAFLISMFQLKMGHDLKRRQGMQP
ncbi:MAG: hypothetical protein HQL51_11470, partial [Magnetococcales bacterium]|nr:hypothetical protein [Magnetococcales bacterium]